MGTRRPLRSLATLLYALLTATARSSGPRVT